MWSHWESDKEIQKTCLSYQRGQVESYMGAGDLNSRHHAYTADTSPTEPFPWLSFKLYCHSEAIELQFITLSYEFSFCCPRFAFPTSVPILEPGFPIAQKKKILSCFWFKTFQNPEYRSQGATKGGLSPTRSKLGQYREPCSEKRVEIHLPSALEFPLIVFPRIW